MIIKILSPLIVKGKETGLYNYQYFYDDETPISAVFQAFPDYIERLQKELK